MCSEVERVFQRNQVNCPGHLSVLSDDLRFNRVTSQVSWIPSQGLLRPIRVKKPLSGDHFHISCLSVGAAAKLNFSRRLPDHNNGEEFIFLTLQSYPVCADENTRSRRCPALYMAPMTCWDRPMDFVVSMNFRATLEGSNLAWMLKSLTINDLDQWSPTLGLLMFLDCNSKKPSPPPLLARISGS